MPVIVAEALPYRPDSAAVFAPVAAEPWAVWLDSGADRGGGGRYDILALAPRTTLVTRGTLTAIDGEGGPRESGDDPLRLLREALGPPLGPSVGPALTPTGDAAGLPFSGGAIGWFGYDLARRLGPFALATAPPAGEPQMAVGVYDAALVTDHRARVTWLVGRADATAARERLRALTARADRPPALRPAFRVTGALATNLDRAAYAARFERVQRHLRDGDCYQVNLARRFSVPVTGDPWPAYLALRALSPAPFGAWLNTPGLKLLSASPERFLAVRGGRVETRPIKGTIRRDADPARDRALAAELAASPKDRAENLMIVDLLRNDLGRCCAIGSVRVPRLFAVESFAGLHHLVSVVTGRLAAGRDAIDLLGVCLPGGSVTGAPKRMAMQVIDALEGEARGPYCGAIGYLGFDGGMDTSIAIRTLAIGDDGRLRAWAGGGLVADSTCDAEWAEIELKARAMLAVIERFRRNA